METNGFGATGDRTTREKLRTLKEAGPDGMLIMTTRHMPLGGVYV